MKYCKTYLCPQKKYVTAKFIVHFFSPKNMHGMYPFFFKTRFVSHIRYDYARHLCCQRVVFQAVNNVISRVWCRRSLCASAFYKKGPARGAKRGACPSSCIQKKVSFQAMRFRSISRSYIRSGRIAHAEPICVAPTSSGLPGTAFRVPRAVGGYADPPVAHGVPYSEYI